MTRTDAEFITQLRQEIMDAQNRRFRYVIAKISFIISLLGLGTIASSDVTGEISHFSTGPLLYLVPFVIFVFDLYIVGEDFGIKRAGGFIRVLESASPAERDWEITAHGTRDIFSHAAGVLSSGIAFGVSAIAIRHMKLDLIDFWLWFSIGLILVAFALVYNYIRDYRLKLKNTPR